MSANMSRGRNRGDSDDSGTQRTCPLSGCENTVHGRFIYCSKEHSRQAVIDGEVEACERCKTYPKNPGYEYCTRACGGMAAAGIPYGGNQGLTISYYQLSLNSNPPGQSGNQPSGGRGQSYQNQNQNRGGGGGRGSGRGRGRGRGRGHSDDNSSDRGSISGISVKTRGAASDGLRTFHFGPCKCSVTTRVTPSTSFCPVCGDGCDSVMVERDGKFTDFLGDDDTINEVPTNDDPQPPTSSNVVPQRRSLPQPGPPVQPQVTVTPQSAPEDDNQQMMEIANARPASLVSRVTVRRLPNPPKPVGPRPAPEHMDIDFPDVDDLDSRVESPTDARTPGPSGYGKESVQKTKGPFGPEHTLPFVPPGRQSPMPQELRVATSPTSPVDPFVQPSSVEGYDVGDAGMQDVVPTPATPVNLPPQPHVQSPQADSAPVYQAPPSPVDPFDDSVTATTPRPATDAESFPEEVVKENQSSSKAPPSQWGGYGPGPSPALQRSQAYSAGSGPNRTTSDPTQSTSYPSGSGDPGLSNSSSSGARYGIPEGGYPLPTSKPQDKSSHLRTDSDGTYGPGAQGMGQLRAPSPLLDPVDHPTTSNLPDLEDSPPRPVKRVPPPGPPRPTGGLRPPPTVPNGSGTGGAAGRSRTPSPTRPAQVQRPHSATGTGTGTGGRPVMISEKQGEPHFGLSNLSYTPIDYPDPNTALDKQYPTPEHLFQAMKFMGHKPLIAEHIRTCGGNPKPREEARRFAYEQDPTWGTTCMDRMYEVLQLKFAAYPGLEAELLDTGNAELVLNSSDPVWGSGPDGSGQNHLGSLLMRLRQELVESLSARIDQTGEPQRRMMRGESDW